MAHTLPCQGKAVHSVFLAKAQDDVLKLLDEAWQLVKSKGIKPAQHGSGNWNFRVDMGRVVGEGGERAVNISVLPNTAELVTAFPVK